MDLIRRARAMLYDAAIVSMTATWYEAVLERLSPGCRLLDVGIGTGSALLTHSERIRADDLHVTGIDIDAAYVAQCRQTVEDRGMSDRIETKLESVYDHRGGPYDAVYFSASFMLLPDPPAALRHVQDQLSPGGRIYFTQTFEHARSRMLETVKPLLRWVTTIDFGRVTYESEFDAALATAGVEVVERQTLHAGRRRSAVMTVARPGSIDLEETERRAAMGAALLK